MNSHKTIIKKFLLFILIVVLPINSLAAVSVSDGSAFVSKSEFSASLNNMSNRISIIENTLDAKIDSLVSSYLSRNGIWNGEIQKPLTVTDSQYGNFKISQPTNDSNYTILSFYDLKVQNDTHWMAGGDKYSGGNNSNGYFNCGAFTFLRNCLYGAYIQDGETFTMRTLQSGRNEDWMSGSGFKRRASMASDASGIACDKPYKIYENITKSGLLMVDLLSVRNTIKGIDTLSGGRWGLTILSYPRSGHGLNTNSRAFWGNMNIALAVCVADSTVTIDEFNFQDYIVGTVQCVNAQREVSPAIYSIPSQTSSPTMSYWAHDVGSYNISTLVYEPNTSDMVVDTTFSSINSRWLVQSFVSKGQNVWIFPMLSYSFGAYGRLLSFASLIHAVVPSYSGGDNLAWQCQASVY